MCIRDRNTGVTVTGLLTATTLAGTITTAAQTNITSLGTLPSIDIDGGNIDGTTIATSDITVGSGKTLDVSGGTLTLANDQISGDNIQGGTIGSTTITTLDGTTIKDFTTVSGSSTSTGSFGIIELENGGLISFTQGELSNTVIGNGGTGQNLDTSGGRQNTLIGYTVGGQITTGDQNVAIGQENLSQGNSTGNTAIGYRALKQVTTGIGNVGVGRLAGDTVQNGNYNIAIGQGTDFTGTAATNQIGIGYDVVVPGDNQTVIGASPQTHVIFGGSNTLISGSAGSTGSFGIIENNTQIAGFRPIINQTADFSASLSNAGRYHIVHGNLTCSIGTDASMPVTIGAEYEFFQSSSVGKFLFQTGSGVTLLSKNTNRNIAGQYSGATLKKVDTDTYHLVGDLT